MTTILEALESELPSWLLNDFADDNEDPAEEIGGGFVGCVFGLVGDVCAHVLTFCCRGRLLKDPGLASDVVQDLAWERGLPRYYQENTSEHAQRLAVVWDACKFPGEVAIKQQLAAYVGCDESDVAIYDADEWPTEFPVGVRSQFWVDVPYGSHSFDVPRWGSVVCGQFRWGISGATLEQTAGLRSIVRKWKPVQWVCRQIRFELSGGFYASISVNQWRTLIL
jgi:hypothetical protein